MKAFAILPALLLARDALAGPVLSKKDTCTSNDLGLPSGGMKMNNGVPFGWLPDWNASTTMAEINKATGKKASTYGWYSQITSTSGYDGSQLLDIIDDVKSSGAVFIPAVMLQNLHFTDVTPAIATDIANVVKKFTSEGITVWLRFLHEMNYYSTTGQYIGTAPEFVQAWKNVHDAVKDIEGCLMFWSPNVQSVQDIQPWYPGDDYVDIIGLDDYPDPNTSFDSAYGDFYQTFVVPANKHFALGETSSHSAAVADKEAWLKQLATADTSKYPCFQSVSWFEYLKDGHDFRIVMGQTPATVKETLSNFK